LLYWRDDSPPTSITPGWKISLENIHPEKRNILIFSCHWNGSQVDIGEHFSQTQDANLVFINLLCTGQIESSFILNSFEKGADGVLITGCASEECHYDFGTDYAEKSIEKTRMLTHMLGIESHRLGYSRLPKGDTDQFVKTVRTFVNEILKNPEPVS